jgi:hypothetical protein
MQTHALDACITKKGKIVPNLSLFNTTIVSGAFNLKFEVLGN